MRLPRLPLPNLSFDWLESLGGRRTLLYAGYTAALFVIFLVVTFPHGLLVRRLMSSVRTGPVDVDFRNVNFAWYKGYEIAGITVTPEADGSRTPYFECSQLFVRPSLAGLLHGHLYDLVLNASLYGGEAQGEVAMDGGGLLGNLAWHDLKLGSYRTLTALLDSGQIGGRVSGNMQFETHPGNGNRNQGAGVLVLEGASLTGAKIQGFSVPDLHFRRAQLKFATRGDRLEVQEFQATGDLDVQASGHLILREPLADTALNLRATVQTSLATPDAIKTLVAMIPRTPGAKLDAPISITGTLAHPRTR